MKNEKGNDEKLGSTYEQEFNAENINVLWRVIDKDENKEFNILLRDAISLPHTGGTADYILLFIIVISIAMLILVAY